MFMSNTAKNFHIRTCKVPFPIYAYVAYVFFLFKNYMA